MAAMHCYVYYRVAGAQASAARALVDALFQRMAAGSSATPRLQIRCDPVTGEHDGATSDATWMELYPDVSPGFVEQLEQQAAQLGLTQLLEGGRHVECFCDVPPCA